MPAEASQEPRTHAAGGDEATRAGRGVLLTMTAKAVFIGTGFGTQLVLPHLLGDEGWGRYSTVGTITSIVTNTLVAATVQSVSRRTSEGEGRGDRGALAAQREGLVAALGLALLLGGGFALASPWLAGSWQRDPTMTPLFATAAVVIASYALYSAQIGAINGRRQFARQAGFDIAFAIARSGSLIAGAAVGSAAGALAGWAGASVAMVIGASVVAGLGARGRLELGPWLAFFLPIAIYQASLNGVLQADQPLLRGHLADMAIGAGTTASEANALASRIAGQYRAAQTFAFVPYQLILAVTFVVFPTVSRSAASGDLDATRAAIRGAMRFSLIVVLAMAAPIAGASDGVMRIAYPEQLLGGSDALAVLAIALVPFSLFAIAASILAGTGRSIAVMSIAALGLAVVVIGNAIAVRSIGPVQAASVGAACATGIGAIVALVAAGLAIRSLFGTFIPIASAIRALIAAACAALAAHLVPHASRPTAVLALVLGAVVYVTVLVIIRELGRDDLALLTRVLGRRRTVSG